MQSKRRRHDRIVRSDQSTLDTVREARRPAAEFGLRDVLVQAHELRGLGGESPLVTAALHRLLLAILHRVFGPEGYDAWYALWQAGRFDPVALDEYLHSGMNDSTCFIPRGPSTRPRMGGSSLSR